MELICIGFLAGMLAAFVIFAWSVIFDDKADKGKSDGVGDIIHFDPSDDRMGRSVDRYSAEEMNIVLDYFRIRATSYEKNVIDAIKERIGGEECTENGHRK